jgi:chromosome segregation ATPase
MAERPQVSIRETPNGRILLTGLKQVPINSIEDLLNALNFGSAIRQTDATAVNARSSRSHAVFSLNLIQKKVGVSSTPVKEKRRSVPLEMMSGSSDNWVTVDSKLHFVDLAGSERLKNTGALGERAKEGISINAGLASLGKVISQLSARQPGSHVSYRDSKLTRLLQDSLGGNAITYMVACINPAEFHLSETLNTVQYAQRARAIQSKPQIQQIHDDSDKQAVIERLRAEVSFLRDQIRLSERADSKRSAPQERSERQHERETEMQNQLLDVQENYNTLSQRHAKLISQLSKAQGDDMTDNEALHDTIGDTANERRERSRSFQGAVETIILEYEKTIQTLEGSLSSTRGSLSNTESSLLEKETKIAYLETVQQQLQARIQKAMDREANDLNYLRELEDRVDGATTGEEKSGALVSGLRKELARARENETSCEEYISTLEERLAEAEQDHEMMQREIDRLEHVVERQRSINKLDNLLYELDHIRQSDKKTGGEVMINGQNVEDGEQSFHSPGGSAHVNGTEADHLANGGSSHTRRDSGSETLESIKEGEKSLEIATPVARPTDRGLAVQALDGPASPAQSKFVADKLDTVSQELFDLRVEHENTVNDFDALQQKYQIALTTLAELQDAVEDARRGPRDVATSSFLTDAGMNTHEEGQPSSSRTLSSELSSLGESPNSLEAHDDEPAQKARETAVDATAVQSDEQLAQEMEKLKKLHSEKDSTMAELSKRYAQLEEKHLDAMDYVEELKAEVLKAQMSGRASPNPSIIRRKSSQQVTSSGDRANRSFASLRNFALENFEDHPDKIQSFEINLNAAMGELHNRTERVADLEAEVTTLRKEMESKMTIISGLTRERSSLKSASPLDMSAIASMHDQLTESEHKIKVLSEAHASREQQLLEQIAVLKSSLSTMPGGFPETPMSDAEASKQLNQESIDPDHQRQVYQLQKEVADWRSKHDSAMESVKALETSLRSNASRSASPEDLTVGDHSDDKKRYEEIVKTLKTEVNEHRTSAAASATRLAELEQSYNKILVQVDEDSKSKELTEKELVTHRNLVANLESQIEEHKNAVATHTQTLETLRDTHSRELVQTQTGAEEKLTATLSAHQEATAALEKQLADANATHDAATLALQSEISKVKEEMREIIETAGMVMNKPTNASNIASHIQTLVNARKDISALHTTASDELKSVREELDAANAHAKTLEGKCKELQSISEETLKELEVIGAKEKKSSQLVEELEEQLNSNYDQTQAANHRLSAMQSERHVKLEETVGQLQDAQAKITLLEVSITPCNISLLHRLTLEQTQLAEAKRVSNRTSMSLDPRDAELQRSNSGNNLRKSVAPSSLPSPPPAIPLPPLPGGPPASGAPSPPTSRHQSKDIAQAQLVEDQEARIRTIEKHLFAEKQLTATLEEALTDLESSSNKMKTEMEAWRRKCTGLEEELTQLRKERQSSRLSVQQLEEERNRAKRLEAQRAALEQRMLTLEKKGRKKGSSINCF